MNANLTRVQVYLDAQNLMLIDNMAKNIKVTRSQIIRDAVDAVASRYSKMAIHTGQKKTEKNPLLKLSGIAVSKTGRIGLDVDELYSHD